MKQDKNKVSLIGSYGNFAGIELFSYFRKNKKNQSLLAPQERLLAFLNLDIANDEAVIKYIQDYQIIPNGNYENNIITTLLNNFREEYKSIKSIAKKASKNELTQTDLDFINSKLSEIKTKLKYLSEDEIKQINENLDNLNKGAGKINVEYDTPHLVTAVKYPYSFLQLYQDLYYYCLGKANLRNCNFCGNFFHPNRRNQYHCDALHKEKSREERRKKTRTKLPKNK